MIADLVPVVTREDATLFSTLEEITVSELVERISQWRSQIGDDEQLVLHRRFPTLMEEHHGAKGKEDKVPGKCWCCPLIIEDNDPRSSVEIALELLRSSRQQ